MPFNLNDMTTNYGSKALMDANNLAIETEVNDNLLKRNNPRGDANHMEVDLDMNSNDINNVNTVSADQIRLAGELLSTSPSALPSATEAHLKAGRRNLVINGNFDIWQRGTSFLPSAGEYTADRWYAPSPRNAQRSTDVPSGEQFIYSMQIDRAAASNATISTLIELPSDGEAGLFQIGKTFTLSGWVKAPSGRNVNSYIEFTDSSVGGNAVGVYGNTVLSVGDGTWQYFESTFTVSAAPNGTNKALRLYIFSDNDSVDTTINFTGVQLEKGSVATDFEYRPIAEELALCQRYYYLSSFISYACLFDNSGISASSVANGDVSWPHPVTMRGSPTVSVSNGVFRYAKETGAFIDVIFSPTSYCVRMRTESITNGKVLLQIDGELSVDAEL